MYIIEYNILYWWVIFSLNLAVQFPFKFNTDGKQTCKVVNLIYENIIYTLDQVMRLLILETC